MCDLYETTNWGFYEDGPGEEEEMTNPYDDDFREPEPLEYGICLGAMPAPVYDTILEMLAAQTQELTETVSKVERLRAHGIGDDRLLPYELHATTYLAAVQGAAEWLMYTMQGLEIEPGGWLEYIGAPPPTPSASTGTTAAG